MRKVRTFARRKENGGTCLVASLHSVCIRTLNTNREWVTLVSNQKLNRLRFYDIDKENKNETCNQSYNLPANHTTSLYRRGKTITAVIYIHIFVGATAVCRLDLEWVWCYVNSSCYNYTTGYIRTSHVWNLNSLREDGVC